LIGMNTAIFSPSGASAGIGFAVPVDTINRVVPVLISTGRYAPPSLGVDVDDTLSRAMERQLGVSGAAILRVQQGSTGDRAGLRGASLGRRNSIIPGDVIVAVDGEAVDSAALLAARLDDYKPGDTVHLKVWREGKEIEVNAKLQQGE
jgi:S1-C subfamily serine protease